MTEEGELLQALIRHGCVNDGRDVTGEAPNTEALLAVLDGCGAEIEVVEPEPTRTSLVARLRGTDPHAPALLLLAHTDVVPVTPERWTHDPFGGELIDDFIWGRGALDMLGYGATMALAFRDHARSRSRLRGDVILAAVADEEMLGRLGSQWLLRERPDLVAADWALTEGGGSLITGPGGTRVAASISEKGVWRLVLTVRGVPRHAALNFGHDDALAQAAEVCRRLSHATSEIVVSDAWRRFVTEGWEEPARTALTDPATIDLVIAQLPSTPAHLVHASTRMTLAVTSISTDGSWNTVPSEARIEVQVRTVPGQTDEDVIGFLRSALEGLGTEVDIDLCEGGPATMTLPSTALWEVTQRALQRQLPEARLQPTVNPGSTDAREFRRRGTDAYGVGLLGPDFPLAELSTMMHGDDERIDLASLSMMRQFWRDTLELHAEVEAR